MDNYVLFIMDGVRYDVFNEQEFDHLPNDALKSYSAACWTLPSFFSMLLGWSPANAERWKFNFGGQADWIPEAAQIKGYHTEFHSGSAWFSLTHLKQMFSNGFDNFDVDYREKNRMREYTEVEYDEEPFFHVFHVLETHHPFYDGEKVMEAERNKKRNWSAQERSLEYVDEKFGEMVSKMPEGTTITLTADHADAWGEGDSWGHNTNSARMEGFMLRKVGEKVMEVPYSRGKVKGDKVEWEEAEELKSEWRDPREADVNR